MMTETVTRWRPEVVWFTDQMEAKLQANDHKGGWQGDDPLTLIMRLHEEAAELELAHEYPMGGQLDTARIIEEAADVANFAMMIADIARSNS